MSEGCDHKFVDSNVCLKCGWTPGEVDAARHKELRRSAYVLTDDPADVITESGADARRTEQKEAVRLGDDPDAIYCDEMTDDEIAEAARGEWADVLADDGATAGTGGIFDHGNSEVVREVRKVLLPSTLSR